MRPIWLNRLGRRCGVCCGVLPPTVDGIVAASPWRLRRRKNHISAAAIASIMISTATNVPATLPVLEKKPPLLSFAATTVVEAAAGGAVGVTVKVLTCPVIVITEVYGVGVHVLLLEDVVGRVIGLIIGVIVGKIVGVVVGAVVVVSGVIETGFIVGVMLVDVVVGV